MVVHELGHYLAARVFHMRVTRFSIGFGPALFQASPEREPDGLPDRDHPVFGLRPNRRDEPARRHRAERPRELRQRVASLAASSTIFAGPLANYLFASVLFFSATDHRRDADAHHQGNGAAEQPRRNRADEDRRQDCRGRGQAHHRMGADEVDHLGQPRQDGRHRRRARRQPSSISGSPPNARPTARGSSASRRSTSHAPPMGEAVCTRSESPPMWSWIPWSSSAQCSPAR